VTATTAAVRFHIGLHVSDLDRSVRFYRVLLGVEPAKQLHDYAKFELDEPPLVLALYPSPQAPGGTLNHAGLRFPASEALVEVQRRLEEAGIATQRQEGVECCYARQTKFWVTDPDRTLWEIYTLHEDIDHSGFEDPPVSPDAASETLWQHRLTDPLPERIPYDSESLDEIILEGTFNANIAPAALSAFLQECSRVLKVGGKISAHGLVGDKPFPGTPKLPGLASLVQHVPVESDALQRLATAGFGSLAFEKLGDIQCFHVNGVELREMRLTGRKVLRSTGLPTTLVMYKGPFAEVVGEGGTVFPRGVAMRVTPALAENLQKGPAVEQFAFLPG
jgi:catechol 2,3-dioxygenase-like lactoylglutathione lyase family enzyme